MFFKDRLFFINTSIPKPELTNKPPDNAPKDSELDKYNSVNKSEEAQFGIRPIIDANNGAKYLLIETKLENFSSPIKPIKQPKTKLITKT